MIVFTGKIVIQKFDYKFFLLCEPIIIKVTPNIKKFNQTFYSIIFITRKKNTHLLNTLYSNILLYI